MAADEAITTCGGNARDAVRALIVANQFLESDLEKLKAAVSMGYARGKLFEQAKTLRTARIGTTSLKPIHLPSPLLNLISEAVKH
jgi:hypothetical protein